MPITFQSATRGDVVFLDRTAREILTLLGKDPEAAQGIITPPQLPQAIAALQAAMAKNRSEQPQNPALPESSAADEIQQDPPLFQRGQPLLSLLDFAHQQNIPVTWGT